MCNVNTSTTNIPPATITAMVQQLLFSSHHSNATTAINTPATRLESQLLLLTELLLPQLPTAV